MKNKSLKKILSGIMAFSLSLSFLPMNIQAAQSNEYIDPADYWIEANGRTNEFDINATTTYETFYCPVCDMQTTSLVYRVPEYTRSGESALTRNIRYSDGTFIDESGYGDINFGTPGINGYYTGTHWTKSVCQSCHILNTVDGFYAYARGKNVYILNSCDHNFFEDFDNTTYEQYNSTYHTTILKKGEFCQYCKGTQSRATEKREVHNFVETVDAQMGNQRFYVSGECEDCGYSTGEYVVAKSVVSSYYGIADGDAHTVSLSDLSDGGVNTSIRYGTSAGNCNKTSAPNYTQAGYYPIYYDITYSYSGESMTESGVSYVWLLSDDSDKESDTNTIHVHDFRYIETIKPACDELGFERWQCSGCGSLEKRNYIQTTGHDYEKIVIREADCVQGGFVLNMCQACGDFYTETTPTAAHSYEENNVSATCIKAGYTEHICTTCGDKYITDITNIVSHAYESMVIEPSCEAKGYTSYTCSVCNNMYVDEYTDETGHAWDEGRTVTASGCVSEGVIEYKCTNEGCREKLVIATDASGHTPGAEATCTEPQICEVCETVLELPKGHHHTSEIVEPTCTSMGYSVYTCECGDTYTSDYTDKAEHNYEAEVTEPTCTSHGFTTYRCADCDDEYVGDYTDKKAHNYVAEIKNPTCTEMGYSTYTCNDCGDSYVSDYTDVLEHNYNKETIEPTCTEHGYAIYTCPDCGKSYIGDYSESIKHTYSETVIAPTCTDMGYTIFKCNDCDDEYKGNYTDKIPHDYTEDVTESTCLKMGYTVYTCDCGNTYKADYTEAKGHELSDWIIDVPATIEAPGSKHIECVTCGETLQTAEIAQLIDKDNSDEDGNAEVGDYFIILTDKESKPIFDSEITIDIDDKVTIKLPGNRLLDFEDRTTITVFNSETKEAVSDLQIFIYDNNNNAATGKTDVNGQLVVPNNQSSTGDDNGTIGGEDEEENKYTYVVTVTDKTNTVIPNCDISIGESNNIVVTLPDGTKPSREEPVIITVTDHNGVAQRDVTIIAIGTGDYIEKGTTDMYGKVTLPITDEGYTDEDGKVNVEQINVIVNDETELIPNAFVKHNEDGSINVSLPENKGISYDNRITVTVLDSMGNPVKDRIVTVSDNAEESYTAVTDGNGRIVVPPSYIDYTDINGYSEVDGFIVTVVNETNAIEKAFITHNPEVKNEDETVKTAENITVLLPAGNVFDYANRIMVTVQNKADKTAVKAMNVVITEAPVKAEDETEEPVAKTLNAVTDENGKAVFPPLNEDITDNDGNSGVEEIKPGEGENPEDVKTEYKVIVNDTKGVISNALVKIEDGKVTVTLPETHTLTTSNQTTVTVMDNEGKAVSGVSVTIEDKATSNSGTTDANGKVTLPVKTSGGGGGGSYSGGGGGGGSSYASTTVKVVDKDGKTVSVTRSVTTAKATLTLPSGKNLLKDDNYYTITVTSGSKAKADYAVVLKDKNGNEVAGTTNADGVIILPGGEHKAYVEGYNDGTFRPDGDMTRAEAAAIFARLIAETKGESITGRTSFNDVSSKEWYYSYIGYLEKYNVIEGYNDNNFNPEKPVTRAEFVAMTVRYYAVANEVDKVEYTVNYTDISNKHWAYKDVAFAKHTGWLNGYADGSFKLDVNISRAEVVAVVNRATGRIADKEYIKKNYTKINRFTDVTNSDLWFFADVLSAANTIQCADCPHLD